MFSGKKEISRYKTSKLSETFNLGYNGFVMCRCIRPRKRPLDIRLSIFVMDLPRIHERICWSLEIPCGFHYTQLTPLEHMSHVQLQWLERFRLHHEARQLSSSQRRAERFAYMTKEEEGEDVEECWIQHMLFLGGAKSW